MTRAVTIPVDAYRRAFTARHAIEMAEGARTGSGRLALGMATEVARNGALSQWRVRTPQLSRISYDARGDVAARLLALDSLDRWWRDVLHGLAIEANIAEREASEPWRAR